MMGLPELQGLAHALEDRVVELMPADDLTELLAGVDHFRVMLVRACRRDDGEAVGEDGEPMEDETGRVVQESVRVAFSALDSLVDLLSEMVIFRNRLSETLLTGIHDLPKTLRMSTVWQEVEASQEILSRTLDEIQAGIMRLRMVPLGSLFGQLKRIVHDESQREGKLVELVTAGGETPLDKALLEVANEAMGHIVRNAIIHGVEEPEDRLERGKPRAGVVSVTASAETDEAVIEIRDDGRGIDRGQLLERARGLGFEVADEVELDELLPLPGLTTRDTADRSAGRGMGMAAVVESVRRRGGQVELFSEEGRGTMFRLRLPLTAAIIHALLVTVDGATYAVPLSAVKESIGLADFRRHEINQAGVVRWRRQLVTLLDIGVAFETATEERPGGYVIVIEAEGRFRGLVVDELAGIRDVVVKGLDEVAGAPSGIGGCTILGDGRVVLILDPPGLVRLSPFKEHAR